MGFPLNDLGSAFTEQIYQTVMGGDDDTVKPNDNTFFTWVMPGLPFSAEDLEFCSLGIFSAADAETQNKRAAQAYNLATLLDFIPDIGLAYTSEKQAGMYKPDAEKRLSEMYRQILRFSKVADYPLTEEQQAKLDNLRGKLWVTKKVTNLVTDEEDEVTEPSPLMNAYNDKMVKYLDAATEYNSKRAAAAGATGAEGKQASADWILNQQNYFLKVKAAADAWTSGGYRNEVDDINAYINQTTQRSLKLWKQQLLERYDQAQISTPEVGVSFPYTTLVPGDLANSRGWTGLKMSQNTTEWAKSTRQTSWRAGGGLNLGLWSFRANGQRKDSSYTENHQVSDFSLEFEMCQALIVRAGFYPEFFSNRGWTLRKGEGWMFDDLPSDGARPPKGEFIGYATQAIFVRDVTITSEEFVSAFRKTAAETEVGGGVGWGPVRLSGNYQRSTENENFKSEAEGKTLTVPGMQIVGFVNHLIGKAPNPLEDLDDTEFV
ncbi:hypothetical protein [Phytoactinopolyspora limicola]|uniref:hypothetical protein n=1 Tax=Phytoactinopolyspora limicola TaxID=2715536 RepID=UPI00140E3B84|nr:hypothetical protein [Phytoactinopolyspora limicola]